MRVRGWVNRFIDNSRTARENRESGELKPKELVTSEEQIIKQTQEIVFPKEMAALKKGKPVPKTSSLLKLNPMLENGVMRSNTRLRNADATRKTLNFR